MAHDYVGYPLGVVGFTFDRAVASGSDPTTFAGKDWGATALFNEFLFDNGGLDKVPVLNRSTIKLVRPNTLVRFRGMIQDMLGNEYYIGMYKDNNKWKTNKYADVGQCPMDYADVTQYAMDSSPDHKIWERQMLYCVTVPGENSWVASCEEATAVSPQRKKRQRTDSVHAPDGNPRNSLALLVKIYDVPESDLKLNDVFEFVGIFSLDPDLTADSDEDDFAEDEFVNLPPTEVPRLNCVVLRKLGATDFILKPQLELTVKEVRESLLEHLTAVIGNDRLAAEYILLHLLSKVRTRVGSLVVGNLSLNLTDFNSENASIFAHPLKLAIESLVPFTLHLPLTVDYLNTASLFPKKDDQTNRLVSGFLQLAEGSHLTIDETQLQTGILNATGRENASVLKNMMDSQKVEYDFTCYKKEMDVDVQVLVLSEGKSDNLPADLVLPFRPSSVNSVGVAGDIKAWRWYLATMKSLPHSIEPPIRKVLEKDYVAARQSDRSVDIQEFSRNLTMGRLISTSLGESSLSIEHWETLKKLERMRKKRLSENM